MKHVFTRNGSIIKEDNLNQVLTNANTIIIRVSYDYKSNQLYLTSKYNSKLPPIANSDCMQYI